VDAPAAFRLFCEDRMLNISPAYMRPGFAFGGSCLPKDVRSFLSLADRRTVAAPLLATLLPGNDAVIDRAFRAVTRHGRQPIALFGLAFKQGTDDLRESPYVILAERLIGRGYALSVFDRSVNVAALLGANRAYIDREIPHLERLLAASPAEALEGAGIAVIGHVGRDDRPALLAALKGQAVIDLAGMAGLADLPGITYEGLCW
jgi:GDP-mannose 6-dehydrogenase